MRLLALHENTKVSRQSVDDWLRIYGKKAKAVILGWLRRDEHETYNILKGVPGFDLNKCVKYMNTNNFIIIPKSGPHRMRTKYIGSVYINYNLLFDYLVPFLREINLRRYLHNDDVKWINMRDRNNIVSVIQREDFDKAIKYYLIAQVCYRYDTHTIIPYMIGGSDPLIIKKCKTYGITYTHEFDIHDVTEYLSKFGLLHEIDKIFETLSGIGICHLEEISEFIIACPEMPLDVKLNLMTLGNQDNSLPINLSCKSCPSFTNILNIQRLLTNKQRKIISHTWAGRIVINAMYNIKPYNFKGDLDFNQFNQEFSNGIRSVSAIGEQLTKLASRNTSIKDKYLMPFVSWLSEQFNNDCVIKHPEIEKTIRSLLYYINMYIDANPGASEDVLTGFLYITLRPDGQHDVSAYRSIVKVLKQFAMHASIFITAYHIINDKTWVALQNLGNLPWHKINLAKKFNTPAELADYIIPWINETFGKEEDSKEDSHYSSGYARALDKHASTHKEWTIKNFSNDYDLGYKLAPLYNRIIMALQKLQKSNPSIPFVVHGRDGEMVYLIAKAIAPELAKNMKYALTSRPLTTHASDTNVKWLKYIENRVPKNEKAIHVDTGFVGSIPDWFAANGWSVDKVVLVSSELLSRALLGYESLSASLRNTVLTDIEHCPQRLREPGGRGWKWGKWGYSNDAPRFWARYFGILDNINIAEDYIDLGTVLSEAYAI